MMEEMELTLTIVVLVVIGIVVEWGIGWLSRKKLKVSLPNHPTPDKKEYKYVPNGPNSLIREDIKEAPDALEPIEREPQRSYTVVATKLNIASLVEKKSDELATFIRHMALRCDWNVTDVLVRDLLPSDLGLKSWMTYFIPQGSEGSWQKWVDVELPAGKHLFIYAIHVFFDNDTREIRFTHGHLSPVKTVRDLNLGTLSCIRDEDSPHKGKTGYFMPAVTAVQPYNQGDSLQFSIEYFSLATSGWKEIQLLGKVIELAGMDPRRW